MFEVRLMVEDKKLSDVLWVLDGMLAQPPQIIPVRGATVKKTASGEPKVVGKRKGSLQAQLDQYLSDRTGQTITTKQVQAMMVQAGGATNSHYGYIFRCKKAKMLKPTGKEGEYVVTMTTA